MASCNGHLEVVRELLSGGAAIDQAMVRRDDDNTDPCVILILMICLFVILCLFMHPGNENAQMERKQRKQRISCVYCA